MSEGIHDRRNYVERDTGRGPVNLYIFFGTPDLCIRGERFVNQRRVEALERVISSVRGHERWVLGPIVPPRESTQHEDEENLRYKESRYTDFNKVNYRIFECFTPAFLT